MKLIIRQMTAILLVIASVALLVLAVPAFKAPIGGFFGSMVGKQTTIGNDVLASINSSDFKPGEGSGGADDEDINLTPALYDKDNKLLAHWETLVNDYGLNVERDYTGDASCGIDDIIKNNAELSTGVKLVIGNGVTKIGNYAFQNCTTLSSIVMPNTVVNIGHNTFHGCTALKNITIPDSVTTIESMAFSLCSSLEKASLGNGVTVIGDSSFVHCTSLKSITIPNSVTTIGNSVFVECTSLEKIKIGSNVRSIGATAFVGCDSLQSITIPDSVISLGTGVFNRCVSLKSVKIGSSVKNIPAMAFSGCHSLNSITIPESVETIGYAAFSGCESLLSATFENTDNWKVNSTPIDVSNPTTNATNLTSTHTGKAWACVAVGEGKILERGVCGDNLTWEKNSDGTLTISGTGNMYDYSSISAPWHSLGASSVIIKQDVTSIGKNAFGGCSLTSVTFENTEGWRIYNKSEGVESIIDVSDPVTNATNLKSTHRLKMWVCGDVENPDVPDADDIRDSGTCGENLTWELTYGGTLNISGTGAMVDFKTYGAPWSGYMDFIKNIKLGSSVTSIGDNAFRYCASLTSVTIPNSVESIGMFAFYGCSALTSVTFENTEGWNRNGEPIDVTNPTTNVENLTVNYGTFWARYDNDTLIDSGTCGENLTWELTYGGTLTISGTGNMKDYYFDAPWGDYYDKIKNIKLNNGITHIGNYAFDTLLVLESVTIPDTVTSIGESAFGYCEVLESITIPKSVTKIVMYAFDGCSALTSVTFENTSSWRIYDSWYDEEIEPSIDVTDPSANATYLTSDYYEYDWTRN